MEAIVDCHFFAAIVLILISVERAFMYFSYYTAIVITCTALAVMIAVVQQYSYLNRLEPLMIFFLIIWLVSYIDIRMAAGKCLKHQNVSVALCFILLILLLILIMFYLLQNFILKQLTRYYFWKRLSNSLEQSQELEQHAHHPHIEQLDYVSAKHVFQDSNDTYPQCFKGSVI